MLKSVDRVTIGVARCGRRRYVLKNVDSLSTDVAECWWCQKVSDVGSVRTGGGRCRHCTVGVACTITHPVARGCRRLPTR